MKKRGLAFAAVAATVFGVGAKTCDLTFVGYTGTSTLENFPALVKLPMMAEGFTAADSVDGIWFTDETGRVIPHEVDSRTEAGDSFVWVKVPKLVNAKTKITLHWSEAAKPAPAPSATEVWKGYAGVWHLNEAKGVAADASGNGRLATPGGGEAAKLVGTSGIVGGGRVNATAAGYARGYLTVAPYTLGDTFTVSGWFKAEMPVTGHPRAFSRKAGCLDADGWEVFWCQRSTMIGGRGGGKTFPGVWTGDDVSLDWVQVTAVYAGRHLTIYENGVRVNEGTIDPATDNGKPLVFGCDADGNEVSLFGKYDELRLTAGALSSDRVMADYLTVRAPEKFLSVRPAPTPAESVDKAACGGDEAKWTLMKWFLDNEYGHPPVGRPKDMTFEGNSIVFGNRVKVNLTVALPAGASAAKPCPVLLMGDFRTWNNGLHDDELTRKQAAQQADIDRLVTSRGYAIVHYDLNEVVPDQPRRAMVDDLKRTGKNLPQCPYGVFELYGGHLDRTATSWGTIRAWAWCHSRVLDWIETQPMMDAKRVAVLGHSRLGKTALCAGVTDPRFKVVYSNASGCGGAKKNKFDFPASEHIVQITRGFPYWFCRNFYQWCGRDMEITHDQDEWMGLIAPRYLYVASGSKDRWAGPPAEKAAAEAAAKAWEKRGLKGMGGHVGYHCHEGPHDLGVYDIKLFLDFCDTRL